MYLLTEILSPDLPQTDWVAAQPAWQRGEFNRAVFYLSHRLRQQAVQTVAVWCEDAAWFACVVLAAWHAGAKVLLPPNLVASHIAWGNTAQVWLSDLSPEKAVAAGVDMDKLWQIAQLLQTMPSDFIHSSHWQIAPQAEAYLKTSGSSGQAQIVVKTAAQMQDEAQALAATIPFAQQGLAVVGSVSPQHMYGFTFRFALALSMGWLMDRRQNVYPETLLAASMAYPQSVWIASPAVLNRLGEARNWQAVCDKVVGIVSAGGALPDKTAHLLAKQVVQPFEVYGSTETGVIASRQNSGAWQPFQAVQVGQNPEGALWVQSPWTIERFQTADMVEPQGKGFILLGRQDRVIKFEDKRVSLNQMEHDLLAHEWVIDAYCSPHPQHKRPAMWVALNAKGICALQDKGRAEVVAVLKKHLAATQDAVALPRYWRFTDVLPRNAQAKITAVAFQQAFLAAQTTPEWQECTDHLAENHCFESRVPLDLVYFSGHFAHFPLVPGVVELQWISELAARFEWGNRPIVRVENLKYQQFLRPYDKVRVELKYDAEKDKLVFKLSNAEAICALGRMVFGNMQKSEIG